MISRLTLVSESPRRQQLLARLNIPFDIAPSLARELWSGGDAEDVAKTNAERKVTASKYFGDHERLLLGADTLINLNGLVLGKPAGQASAQKMLESLSGRTHQVVTGFCLVSFTKSGEVLKFHSEAVVSNVQFHDLRPKAIRKYLQSDEWKGKAGAYAIQGRAAEFVLAISGDYDNIVGLPVTILQERLGTHFSDHKFL